MLPEDVRELAPEVLRHRIMLSYEALADDVKLEEVVQQIIAAVSAPQVHIGDPHRDVRVSEPSSRPQA